jgi:hypothetical protein
MISSENYVKESGWLVLRFCNPVVASETVVRNPSPIELERNDAESFILYLLTTAEPSVNLKLAQI